jgi:hypothetical protein
LRRGCRSCLIGLTSSVVVKAHRKLAPDNNCIYIQ